MNTAMNLSVIPLLSAYRNFEDRVTCHRLWGYSLTSDYLTVFHNFVRVVSRTMQQIQEKEGLEP